MAYATIELRTAMESMIGLEDREEYPQIQSVIEQARPIIFDFDYPIFDPEYKPVLETKILKKYYLRELCDIPVGKWKLLLNIKMNDIMPYYNQLYKSQLLSFEPLLNRDYTRNLDRNRNDNSNENGKVDLTRTNNTTSNSTTDSTVDRLTTTTIDSNTNQKNRHSDTPQGTLQNLETGKYMSQGDVNDQTDHSTQSDEGNDRNHITGKDDTTSTGTDNTVSTNTRKLDSTEKYLESIKGVDGISYSKLLMEFRESFLNIDLMIEEELEILFWPMWD